jgi:hypothetical protein
MVCFEGCNEVKQPSPKWLVLVPYPVVAIYDVGRGARDKKWKIGAVFYFLVSGRRITLETKSVRSEALSDACITRANAPVIPKKLMRPVLLKVTEGCCDLGASVHVHPLTSWEATFRWLHRCWLILRSTTDPDRVETPLRLCFGKSWPMPYT